MSAAGDGFNPAFSNRARMNASTGFVPSTCNLELGTWNCPIGFHAQCMAFRWARSKSSPFPGGGGGGGTSFGHGAPSFTHASSAAMASAGSLPTGGMSMSLFVYFTASISLLLAGSPGTRAGPPSPPSSSNFRPSTRSPPFTFLLWAEWHL